MGNSPYSLSRLIAVFLCSWTYQARATDLKNEATVSKHSVPGSYGYYKIRDGAYTFWWQFPAKARAENIQTGKEATPLILWLQGGPGASGTGFGNFEEVGPYGINWEPRQHSWAEAADLLFVDSPVGTGFSYVTSNSSYAKDNSQIAADLTEFLRQYLDEQQAYDQPLFIFSESYGGKVCADFALHLIEAQKSGRIKVNLRGVALGDSWISPIDYVFTWGDYLKAFSLLDSHQLSELAPLLLNTQAAMEAGNLTQATDEWGLVEERIGNLTDNVDWYNVLLHNIPGTESQMTGMLQSMKQGMRRGLAAGASLLGKYHKHPLTNFMQKEVTPQLGIIPDNVTWGSQSGAVFEHLAGDFMTDVISSVDKLLSEGVSVTIYNGQLDLICSTLGLNAWLPKLKWQGLAKFAAASPRPIYAGEQKKQTTGFHRQEDNLSLYIILKAGHMVPADQPEAALDMVRRVIANGLDIKNANVSTSLSWRREIPILH